jgi:hypothetical protein
LDLGRFIGLRYDWRMARKPKDPRNAGVSGPGSTHLGLRFGPQRAEALARVVKHANDVAAANGLPRAFTASSLVVDVINRWLDDETAKLDAAAKRRR